VRRNPAGSTVAVALILAVTFLGTTLVDAAAASSAGRIRQPCCGQKKGQPKWPPFTSGLAGRRDGHRMR
jgi:hypothetical protein